MPHRCPGARKAREKSVTAGARPAVSRGRTRRTTRDDTLTIHTCDESAGTAHRGGTRNDDARGHGRHTERRSPSSGRAGAGSVSPRKPEAGDRVTST